MSDNRPEGQRQRANDAKPGASAPNPNPNLQEESEESRKQGAPRATGPDTAQSHLPKTTIAGEAPKPARKMPNDPEGKNYRVVSGQDQVHKKRFEGDLERTLESHEKKNADMSPEERKRIEDTRRSVQNNASAMRQRADEGPSQSQSNQQKR